jgi:leucyl aminopeptidase (aminopeptidase T)
MKEAAEAVVRDSLGVQAGERVLVIADTGTRAIGEALREAAAREQAEAVLALMDPRERKDLYLAARLDRLSAEELAALERAAGILERVLEEGAE